MDFFSSLGLQLVEPQPADPPLEEMRAVAPQRGDNWVAVPHHSFMGLPPHRANDLAKDETFGYFDGSDFVLLDFDHITCEGLAVFNKPAAANLIPRAKYVDASTQTDAQDILSPHPGHTCFRNDDKRFSMTPHQAAGKWNKPMEFTPQNHKSRDFFFNDGERWWIMRGNYWHFLPIIVKPGWARGWYSVGEF